MAKAETPAKIPPFDPAGLDRSAEILCVYEGIIWPWLSRKQKDDYCQRVSIILHAYRSPTGMNVEAYSYPKPRRRRG